MNSEQWNNARREMIVHHLKQRGIWDRRVLAAMTVVPRHFFVPDASVEESYADKALPIPEGQSISQPYVVALMIQSLRIGPSSRVLEVGTGSGYAAAVLAQIAGQVYTIEWFPALAESAAARFDLMGYRNISSVHGDGSLGWQEAAPFDAILVSAGGPEIPQSLLDQLGADGRLVMPVGRAIEHQELICVFKDSRGACYRHGLGAVSFVPLRGQEGWQI